ncbi:MAG: hypothetical protein U9R42_01710, partial [Bacteroidota bacterium]|nr:hypothetical protein [Bacteroidota bacterium]
KLDILEQSGSSFSMGLDRKRALEHKQSEHLGNVLSTVTDRKLSGELRGSSLDHETKHGIQFEYGELGFEFNRIQNTWDPINYDMIDEVEAHDAQYSAGKNTFIDPQGQLRYTNQREYKRLLTPTDKINFILLSTTIDGVSPYAKLSRIRLDNNNVIRIKNRQQYMLPHKIR